jgi:acyl-coenzyme A thioesterase PaaI-like protein
MQPRMPVATPLPKRPMSADQDESTQRPRLKLAPRQAGFSHHVGPFYEIALPHSMRRALLLDGRHLSPENVVHGGVIASFAEYVLYRGIGDEIGEDHARVSVEMDLKFLAAAFPNRWIYGEAHLLRKTRNLVFVAAEIFDQQRRVAFASGIWRVLGGEEE